MLFVGTGSVLGSGATFKITAEGVSLDKADENQEIPQYRTKAEVGKPVTLIAQGIVIPRGQVGQPGEPDVGAWLFDDGVFQLVALNKKNQDPTKIMINLKPTKAGITRVRFVGTILGREAKFDVLVEVDVMK